MRARPQNWVFLGDSLTEGVGSSRVSFVTELAERLRRTESARPQAERRAIHEFRLRRVDPDSFNRFVRVNTAGLWNGDTGGSGGSLWLWNLACEGTTLEADRNWLPLLENLRPERILIHRGSLESILRPFAVGDGSWPWWVPASWRGYAAMDPRCYFSAARWRRIKQSAMDRLKQHVRLHLLTKGRPVPLMSVEQIEEHLSNFLPCLSGIAGEVVLIGLLPVGDRTFPGSAKQFEALNRVLARLAGELGARFIDPSSFPGHQFDDPELYYRDQFHPNVEGARQIAAVLANSLDPGQSRVDELPMNTSVDRARQS